LRPNALLAKQLLIICQQLDFIRKRLGEGWALKFDVTLRAKKTGKID